jgi:hypothetical protein
MEWKVILFYFIVNVFVRLLNVCLNLFVWLPYLMSSMVVYLSFEPLVPVRPPLSLLFTGFTILSAGFMFRLTTGWTNLIENIHY